MIQPTAALFVDPLPVNPAGVEAASFAVKIVVAPMAFTIAGAARKAFVVGSRTSPITVGYPASGHCREWSIPPWMASGLLGVSGRELAGGVVDLHDLPRTPFRAAVASQTGLSPASIRRLARHERALATIKHTDRPLAQAAFELGYADQPHMTREMKSLSGITPARLRTTARMPLRSRRVGAKPA